MALGIGCANWELGCDALGVQGRFEPHPAPASDEPLPWFDVTWVPA